MRVALRQVLAGHEPYPAVVVDRWWEVRMRNSGLAVLTGAAPRRSSSRRSTRSGSPCTPTGWRRKSSTWRSGVVIC